jgi:hypothetical protein
MPEAVRAKLAAFYAPFNAALYEYLGMDFGWQAPPEFLAAAQPGLRPPSQP